MTDKTRFGWSTAISILVATSTAADMPQAWRYGLQAAAVCLFLWGCLPYLRRWFGWLPYAYELPDRSDIESEYFEQGEGEHGDRYRISLTVTNPGQTDTFTARVNDVRAGDREGLVEYLRWQGQESEKREIKRFDDATLNIGYWDPIGEGRHQSAEETRPGKLTVMSSTGEVAIYQPRESVASNTDLPDNPIKFVLSLRSETTEQDRQFVVSIGPASLSNLEPNVEITVVE